jgi:ATP-binding cassette subfamily B multidrug efflux pump
MQTFLGNESLRYMLSYFAKYRSKLAAGIVCLLVANLLALASPSVLRHVIDGLMANIVRSQLLEFGGLLLLLALAQASLLFLQRRLLIGVARDVEYNLRNDFYAHLQKLLPEFYQSRRTGDLMARATSDAAAIRMIGGLGLISTLNAVFAVTMVLPTMIFVNWKLTAIAFLPLPLLALISQQFSKRIHERAKMVQESYGRLSSAAQEMPTGIRVARAYRQEQAEIYKFRSINHEYVKHNIALIHLSSAFRSLLQFFVGLGFVTVFAYGGYLVIKGAITTGQFVQQTLYLGFLVGPVASFGAVANLYQRAMASMGRIRGIMSIKSAIQADSQAADDRRIQGEIEFRDLTFKYRNAAEPVLENINLRIAPGQIVAFVGGVGSGKTTLVNLVCRLLEAAPGQLLIDGQPIQEIPLRTLRSAIGYVPQETVLFTETVAENIAFGTDECSRLAVEKAAEEAVVAEDIRAFPRGFDTVVGERGLTLSGGQKQRTAIARALVIDPRILILDDALASVDTHTEEQILRRLRRFLTGRTALIVAHRLSTVKDADLIVVLADGCIVERGTHDELLAYDGLYADLYEKQQLEKELTTI